MLGFDPLLEKIFEKIQDAQEAPVIKQQIDLLRTHLIFKAEQLEASEKKVAKLEGKLEAQTEELEKLRSKITDFESNAKFLDIGPCFVKLDQSGKPMEGVYCPGCRMPMHLGDYAAPGKYHYQCMNCKIRLPSELVDVALNDFLYPIQDQD